MNNKLFILRLLQGTYIQFGNIRETKEAYQNLIKFAPRQPEHAKLVENAMKMIKRIGV